MAVRGPLVTAVVVLGGLVGFMAVNSVGGLVVAEQAAEQPGAGEVAATASEDPTQPPVTTTAPPEATVAPPEEPAEDAPPPAPAFPREAVYAGEVDQGPMTIAVAVKGDEAAAYLCDGAQVESWLKGTVVDGRLELASKDGANRVVASLAGDTLTGTVTIAGEDSPFTAPAATAPAGVYRGEGAEATIGWIVLPDGSQVGIATRNGRSEPAPRLDPAAGAVTVEGTRVTAVEVTGDTTF